MLLVYYTWTMKAERNYGSKMKKKTHLEFLVEFEAILGPEYELLSEYAGSQKQVKVKHKVCDEIYEVTPDHRRENAPIALEIKRKQLNNL